MAAAAFFAGIVLAALLGTIAVLVTGDSNSPALLVASFVGLWIPLVAAALMASRLFGTGSPRRDLGLAIEPGDLGWGVVVGVVGLVAATGVQAGLTWVLPQLVGTNTNFVQEQARSAVGAIVVSLSTCIGAPIVEELFFRGLLQRALHRLGIAAVFVQALVFGMIHVTPEQGLGNVSIVVGVGTFGLVLGLAARRFGRLGPTMIGHTLFNAAAVVPLLLSR